MEELPARSQLPVARTVKKKKEAGTSSQRPARTSAPAAAEEDEEEEIGFEESEKEDNSKQTETDFEEDPFTQQPAQPEMWDMYNAIRERRTKAHQ